MKRIEPVQGAGLIAIAMLFLGGAMVGAGAVFPSPFVIVGGVLVGMVGGVVVMGLHEIAEEHRTQRDTNTEN